MNIEDQGFILDKRMLGERSLLVTILSSQHGLIKGALNSSRSKKLERNVQVGNLVEFTWQARLLEHLGTFKIELLRPISFKIFSSQFKILMLQSLFTVLTISLPEGIEENQIYLEIEKFIKNLGSLENTMIDYLNLEITILTQVGYQIDLQTCAVTNKCEKLFYISPKSGRAVTQEAGHKYHDQLFIIPDYFYEHRPINYQEFLDGLKITGHFLQKNIFHHKNIAMPSSRVNLIDYVQKHTDI